MVSAGAGRGRYYRQYPRRGSNSRTNRRKVCTRCGKEPHPLQKCPAKEAICHHCRRRGLCAFQSRTCQKFLSLLQKKASWILHFWTPCLSMGRNPGSLPSELKTLMLTSKLIHYCYFGEDVSTDVYT